MEDTTCHCAELDDDLIDEGYTCYNCYATNKDVSRATEDLGTNNEITTPPYSETTTTLRPEED